MAFVNEYISEEDRSKYKIDESFLKRKPQYKEVPEYWEPHWCRDKDRNLFLMEAGGTNQSYDSDVVDYFEFFLNGGTYIFTLRRGEGCSRNLREDPFVINWELVDVKAPVNTRESTKEAIKLFKEALGVFGYSGVTYPVKNTLVNCSF